VRKLTSNYQELTAYATLCVGFLLLVVLLRADIGSALFDENRLFYKVPDSVPSPALQLDLEYTGGAHVLNLNTEHFRFADVCRTPQAGEPLVGHAHVYLNGRKIASVFEPRAFLPELSDLAPGKHRLTVSLNILPDHRAIMIDGEPVSSDIDLFIPDPEI